MMIVISSRVSDVNLFKNVNKFEIFSSENRKQIIITMIVIERTIRERRKHANMNLSKIYIY